MTAATTRVLSSTASVLVVPDTAVAYLSTGEPVVTLAGAAAAAADAAAALAAAEAAQTTADDAATDAASAQQTADEAVPAASGFAPWGITGYWGRLTHQPHIAGALLTSTVEPGRIVYFPFDPTADIDVVQWAVEVTNTPVGTSVVVNVARYSVNSDGSPNRLVLDYSTSGPITIPNSPAALVAGAAFTQITLPAGHWMLAVLFTGTAGGTPPVLRTVTGHPSIGASTMASLNVNGGYRSPDTSNVGFPPTATIGADQGRGGILLYAKRA